ncbi:MAG TPA: hypothetical protein VJN94_09435 [Candidatus Binataceae bacterium]|nr:hypothetical protein [Candidatus Binataceae bacterium]
MQQPIASNHSMPGIACFALAIVLLLPSAALAKSKPKPPKTNPVPSLTSIVPGSLPALSPATTITLSGSNFARNGFIIVNGSRVAEKFKSTGRVTALLPAALLKLPTTLEIAVVNPGPPGGGPSNLKPFIVAMNGAIALTAIPNSPGTPGSTWQISLATTTSGGAPNTGQPVLLHATHGKFSPTSKGFTDATGAFSATYTPSSTKFTADALSATIGTKASNNLAGVVLNLPSAPPKKRHKAGLFADTAGDLSAPTDPAFTLSNPGVIGFNGAPKQRNSFAIANPALQACVNQFMSSGKVGGACAKPFSKAGFFASAGGGIIQNEACSQVPALSAAAAACVTSSGGIAGLPGTCLNGAQGYQCLLSTAVVQGVSPSACARPITGLEALISFNSQGFTPDNGQFFIQPDLSTPDSAIASACNLNMAPPVPAGETPICGPGQTCFYVADIDNNTISVYDEAGHRIATPAGAFTGLAEPSGLTYDGRNGLIYAVNSESSNLSISAFDLSGTPVTASDIPLVGATGQVIDYDPVNDLLYVGDVVDETILAFDPATGQQVSLGGGFPTGGISNPFGVHWSPLTNYIYVANADSNSLVPYDASGVQLQTPGGFACSGPNCSPNNFAIDPATGNVYAAEAAYNGVNASTCNINGFAKFDLNGNGGAVSGGSFASVDCPNDVLVHNGHVYVTNLTSGSITVYDTSGNDITSAVAPGKFPFGTPTNPPAPTGIIAVTTP